MAKNNKNKNINKTAVRKSAHTKRKNVSGTRKPQKHRRLEELNKKYKENTKAKDLSDLKIKMPTPPIKSK